jgi:hypothetical protein
MLSSYLSKNDDVPYYNLERLEEIELEQEFIIKTFYSLIKDLVHLMALLSIIVLISTLSIVIILFKSLNR